MPGTVLDAKITDMTDGGGPYPHGASILVGETGGRLKDLVHYGRIIPRVASKGTLRAQMGAKNSGWGQTFLHWDLEDEKTGGLAKQSSVG